MSYTTAYLTGVLLGTLMGAALTVLGVACLH